ncbi:hypothetical protein Tco_0025516 [Tanacetum coccineum]
MLRLCHMWIAYNITGRSQALEKVTVTDLFYLRGMDVGLVNIPYLLARYLRMFASRRKRGAMITGGQFVAPLVAPRPERQQVAANGALEVAEGAFDIDEGDQVVLALVHAPQPPPATGPARTMAQRLGRLEEDVHGLRGVLGEQREDLAGKEIDNIVIMECLVKISKKARILELKRRHLKITDSDILYAVSIKEDTAYLCLHFTKDHEGMKSNTPYLEEIHTAYSI